jgi:predicted nucleotidyltransferase
MWIPPWLGEAYARLYRDYRLGLFTFNDAQKSLNLKKHMLNMVLSKLHRERLITIFSRSKPRNYRLLDPESFILMAGGVLKNIQRIKQERYINLLCSAAVKILERYDLTSFVIYGSVARGTAENESDVDILLISDDFMGSVGSRIERLSKIENLIKDELDWLRLRGIHTDFSFYPFRKEEVERMPSILLDLTEDAIIIVDRENYFENLLTKLKARLVSMKAKRVFLTQDRWYWDLKPDLIVGESVPI